MASVTQYQSVDNGTQCRSTFYDWQILNLGTILSRLRKLCLLLGLKGK